MNWLFLAVILSIGNTVAIYIINYTLHTAHRTIKTMLRTQEQMIRTQANQFQRMELLSERQMVNHKLVLNHKKWEHLAPLGGRMYVQGVLFPTGDSV